MEKKPHPNAGKQMHCRNFEKAFRSMFVGSPIEKQAFEWKDGGYTNSVVNGMYIGYKTAMNEVLNHSHGHFIIGHVGADSKIKLNPCPKIHHKYGLAVAEVNRLTKTNIGTKFVVYNSVMIRQHHPENPAADDSNKLSE